MNDRYLIVDLESKSYEVGHLEPQVLREYLGGRGLNVWWMNQLICEKTDAFSEANPLIISAGILTGTNAISASRIQVTAISPLTGILGNSNVGGFWGSELTKLGYLSLIFKGKSKTPVYILITENGCEIRDAGQVWEMDTLSAIQWIRKDLSDDRAQVAVIGPAGENLVRYASVMFGRGDAAGRTGMGAVMGSKMIKGIAIETAKGRSNTSLAISEITVKKLAESIIQHSSFGEWHEFGDSGQVKWLDDFGANNAYNYQKVHFDHVDSANGYALKGMDIKYSTCYKCPVRCKAEIKIPHGPFQGESGERPPFEPMAAWGAKCANPDVLVSVRMHTLCNRLGLDSIETASMIAYVMQLSQERVLKPHDYPDYQIKWGDPGIMEQLVHDIAFRKGRLGNILAEGLLRAGRAIGGDALKYAYHVKGMAMTSMDPRGFKGTGLGYAISSRGADFSNPYPSLECGYNPRRSMEIFGDEGIGDRFSESGKGRMVRFTACVSAILDSVGLCKIPYLSILNDFQLHVPVELLTDVFQKNITESELMQIGERIVTTERLVNLRLGLTKADDRLPDKFRTEPIADGICKGLVVDDQRMVTDFYKQMGWDENGIPLLDKRIELRIAEFGNNSTGE